MAVNDSEKKTEAIFRKRVEEGEELQQFQEAQGQLLNLQAEMRNNLNEQRTVSGMEAQNNQTLAQAAEILAASSGGGIGATIPQVNQDTRGILKKYGIKPGSITKTQTNTVQTPQKVNITNNSTTNTTNNIQMSAPPISQPIIPIRAGSGGGDMERFKVWVSNAFAKQNEAAAIREKEYNKREWSLTRSTNKMIRKMGEIGKDFSESMNPKRLVNTMNNQFKTLMVLMGLHLLAKNITGILKAVDNFAWWISDGKIGNSKSIKGTEVGKISETFSKIFKGDFFNGLKDVFSDGISRLSDELKLILEDRGRAVKAIEFPKIDLKDGIEGVITNVGGYLGDILSAAFTGTEGVVKSKINNFKSSGRAKSLESYEDEYSHTQDISKSGIDFGKNSRSGISMSNVSIGDLVTDANGFRDNYKMAATDYNSFGGLTNNTGASVKQSGHIMNMINKAMESGQAVDISQLTSGLSALSSSARRQGGTLVSIDFMQSIGRLLGLPRNVYIRIIKNMKTAPVRYIIIPKSESEMIDENAGNFLSASSRAYVEGKVVGSLSNPVANKLARERNTRNGNAASEMMVNGANILGYAAAGTAIGSVIPGVGNIAGGGLGAVYGLLKTYFGDNTMLRSVSEGITSGARRTTSDKYTIKMVQLSDPRYEKYDTLLTKSGHPYVDENNNTYLVLTPQIIRELESAVKAQHGIDFRFDAENTDTIKGLHKLLNTNKDTGALINKGSGIEEFEKDLYEISTLENASKAAREELDIKYAGSSINRIYSGWNNNQSNSNFIDPKSITITDNSELYNNAKVFDNEDVRNNSNKIMAALLGDKDLNLTPEQAAGIVGNLMAESNLEPGKHNEDDRGEPASGTAQWRGSRREAYKAMFNNKYPNEDKNLEHEIQFLIHELKDKSEKGENSALIALKKQKNLADSAYNFMVNFERPHSSLYKESGLMRQGYAAQALKTFLESSPIPISTSTTTLQKTDRSLQDFLALQFAPTLGKNTPEIYGKDGEINFINPVADAETAFENMDSFAANQLFGAERAWYENYKNLSKPELEKRLSEEGVISPVVRDNLFLSLVQNSHDGLRGQNSNPLLSVTSIGDFKSFLGKEMKYKDASKLFIDTLKNGGLSGLTTLYLKNSAFKNAKTENERAGAIKVAEILTGKKNLKYEEAVKELELFTNKKLYNKNTPTLSKSTYYHTNATQRAELAKIFIPSITEKEIEDYENWETHYLGKAKVLETTKEKYNTSVFNARANWLKERESVLLEERKNKYLEAYLKDELGDKFEVGKDGKFKNFDPVSKISENILNAWSKSSDKTVELSDGTSITTKSYELPKPLEKLIRKYINKDQGILTTSDVENGFKYINEILKGNDYNQKLSVSKELATSNVVHKLGLGVEEIENLSDTEARDFIENLIKYNVKDKAYIKERLGIKDKYVAERLMKIIDDVTKDGKDFKLNTESLAIIKESRLYNDAKTAVSNYHAGKIHEIKKLKDYIIDNSDIKGTALKELQLLATKPILSSNSNDTSFSLLSEMGKNITSNDLPSMTLDQVNLQQGQLETLNQILRVLSINSQYSKIIAETNYDLLNVDLASLSQFPTAPTTIVSNTEDISSITQPT